jgi:hypothetical protein
MASVGKIPYRIEAVEAPPTAAGQAADEESVKISVRSRQIAGGT